MNPKPDLTAEILREATERSRTVASRSETSPITGHFPRNVRDQLKILAIERSATLHDLMAEAYNDLFAKYGKPEIAPRHGNIRLGSYT